jgi:hypothetical protein
MDIQNSAIGRVDSPIVKIVGIFLDPRAHFVIITYNKGDEIRAVALVSALMAGTRFIKV